MIKLVNVITLSVLDHLLILGTLSNDDDDGREKKHHEKKKCVFSNFIVSLYWEPNVGDFSWS